MVSIESGMNMISKFLATLANCHEADPLFRGHADENWATTPSAFRPLTHGLKTRQQLATWREVTRRFLDRDHSDLELLVLAQHYGVPTPLLDWTTNPLIALLFACQPNYGKDKIRPKRGAVLMISRSTLNVQPETERMDIFNNWIGAPILVRAGAMNRRSLAQDSVMTLHCVGNHELMGDVNPRCFVIEGHEKANVVAALRQMGVSTDRIYADINTVAREFVDELHQAGFSDFITQSIKQAALGVPNPANEDETPS